MAETFRELVETQVVRLRAEAPELATMAEAWARCHEAVEDWWSEVRSARFGRWHPDHPLGGDHRVHYLAVIAAWAQRATEHFGSAEIKEQLRAGEAFACHSDRSVRFASAHQVRGQLAVILHRWLHEVDCDDDGEGAFSAFILTYACACAAEDLGLLPAAGGEDGADGR